MLPNPRPFQRDLLVQAKRRVDEQVLVDKSMSTIVSRASALSLEREPRVKERNHDGFHKF